MTLLELLVQELPKRGGWPEMALTARGNIYGNRVAFFSEEGFPVEPFDLAGDEILEDKVCRRQQYEAALAASKEPEWDGAGSPPVGVTCEHRQDGAFTETEWQVVTVLGISERPDGVFIDFWLRREDGSSYIARNPYRFRTIRTEAERKREEAIKQMMDCSAALVEATAGLIYDAVAAGEIKAFKLAD